MDVTIENAKNEFLRARDGILRALSTTPEDRLNWSPSPTSRTPIQQVAHAAQALGFILEMLKGRPFAVATTAEADRGFREWEAQWTTREEVVRLLEDASAAFVSWLDDLSPDRLNAPVTLPFGLGEAPMQMAFTAAARHTQWHQAQIDYIQTIYGDQDWHG